MGSGGAVLALPWLEALAPKPARGQSLQGPRRFLPISFPCGAPEFWWPALPGAGDDFVLTSVLQPFAPLRDRLLLLGGVENGTAFNADGSSSVEPSHGRLSGGFLTCVDGRRRGSLELPNDSTSEYNGISVDQVLAQARAGQTRFDSLQVGLSTMDSSCDGLPCSFSRSISWANPRTPLYKTIDPQELFDKLFGSPAMPTGPVRGQRDSSVIDAVLASSKSLEAKLGRNDRQILERYLNSLRQLEMQLGPRCDLAPTRPTVTARIGSVDGIAGYDRGQHIDAMNQLIALAFQCDLTRVISYMLEDERSDFEFSNLEERVFTLNASEPGNGLRCHGWHGAQNGAQHLAWSTIQWWHNQKVTELCQLLAAVPEGDGSVLDNTVVFFGSCMHGANHAAEDLPIALIADPKLLATGRYHRFASPCPLRDVYFTLLNAVFGLNEASFGDNLTAVPNRVLDEVLT